MHKSDAEDHGQLVDQANSYYYEEKYAEAFDIYKQLAEKGNTQCQTMVGWMYFQGEGVDKNIDLSIDWLKKAATSNDAEALFYLAKVYANLEDHEKTIELLLKSAAQDYSPALNRLGNIFETGWGVNRDTGKALSYYRKAAQMGHVFGKKRLAVFLVKGVDGFLNIFRGLYLYVASLVLLIRISLKDTRDDRLRT